MRNAYKIRVINTDTDKTIGRDKRKIEDNIKMDLKRIVCNGVS
jgi:hypothetical protein